MVLKSFVLALLISVVFCDTFSFECIAFPGEFICHRDWNGVISKVHSLLDRQSSTFKVVPGLADPAKGNAISFESVNHPGYYLHEGKDALVHLGGRHPQFGPHRNSEEQKQFEKEATFLVEAGNVVEGTTRDVCSLRSFLNPDRFIRARNNKLFVESGNTYSFLKESTFTAAVPNWVPHVAHR